MDIRNKDVIVDLINMPGNEGILAKLEQLSTESRALTIGNTLFTVQTDLAGSFQHTWLQKSRLGRIDFLMDLINNHSETLTEKQARAIIPALKDELNHVVQYNALEEDLNLALTNLLTYEPKDHIFPHFEHPLNTPFFREPNVIEGYCLALAGTYAHLMDTRDDKPVTTDKLNNINRQLPGAANSLGAGILTVGCTTLLLSPCMLFAPLLLPISSLVAILIVMAAIATMGFGLIAMGSKLWNRMTDSELYKLNSKFVSEVKPLTTVDKEQINIFDKNYANEKLNTLNSLKNRIGDVEKTHAGWKEIKAQTDQAAIKEIECLNNGQPPSYDFSQGKFSHNQQMCSAVNQPPAFNPAYKSEETTKTPNLHANLELNN